MAGPLLSDHPPCDWLLGVQLGAANPRLSTPQVLAILVFYVLATAWFQEILLKERLSYYRVLRSVVRLELFLGLVKAGFLSDRSVKEAAPRQAEKTFSRVRNTQPWSSFLQRLAYCSGILFLIALFCFFHSFESRDRLQVGVVALLCVMIDVLWVCDVFLRDLKKMKGEVLREKPLAFNPSEWYDPV